jgi:DeoR/GlpR family transcriptional regulator of sugar metabolism
MGTIGVAAAEGMTTTDPSEAFTKELVMRQARQVVLLADSSKAGKVAFARAGSLEELDVLITDAKISRQFGRELEEKGVKLVKV